MVTGQLGLRALQAQRPLETMYHAALRDCMYLNAVLLLQIDTINDKFVEAREEIETARDDAETTYFNESYTEAQKLTQEASSPKVA